MDQSFDDKELSGEERIARCQNVTFTSTLSKDELDKPKLQRIPTPYYEHLGQAAAGGLEDSAGVEGGEETGAKTGLPLDPGPPPPPPPSHGKAPQPVVGGGEEEKDEVKDLKQPETVSNHPKFSSGRRIHREFSMSRDDDDE